MFQCHYSTEVSGHYGKSLKAKALLFFCFVLFLGFFLGVWGVCLCVLSCLGLFVLGFLILHKVPALGQ